MTNTLQLTTDSLFSSELSSFSVDEYNQHPFLLKAPTSNLYKLASIATTVLKAQWDCMTITIVSLSAP